MGSPATPVELGMDCHRGYRDTGFFRDDPVFRGRAEGSNFFQSGRHKGEEHFWRNIHKTTPHRNDDGYTDYDGYDPRTGRFYNRDRRGNRYLSGTSTSTNQTDLSEEELHRDLRLTKEKTMEDKPMEDGEEDEEEKKKKEDEAKKKEADTESVYAPSTYAPSTFGGSQYEDGVWPRRRKSFFKICNAAPTFYPNLSR